MPKIPDNIKDFAIEIEDNTKIKGVHINPIRKPGETTHQFRKRLYAEKNKALGKTVDPELDNFTLRYDQAFQWFMDGIPEIKDEAGNIIQTANKTPTVAECGLALHISLPRLLQWSINKNWEMLRANKKAGEELAGGEARLQLAKRVDRVILAKTEQVVVQATEAYGAILGKIASLPDDNTEMTEQDDPGDEDGDGKEPRTRTGPKRSRSTLLKTKIGLLNDATKGFFNLCDGARNLGLIAVPQKQDVNENTPDKVIDSKAINALNLTLIQLQQGSKKPEEKTVEPIDTTNE